jgi:hypothetical protein
VSDAAPDRHDFEISENRQDTPPGPRKRMFAQAADPRRSAANRVSKSPIGQKSAIGVARVKNA